MKAPRAIGNAGAPFPETGQFTELETVALRVAMLNSVS